MFAVYLLPPCDICSVDGVDADTRAWRDGHTGQEARILVISIQDLHAQHNKCLELLLRVVFLFHIRNESVFFSSLQEDTLYPCALSCITSAQMVTCNWVLLS